MINAIINKHLPRAFDNQLKDAVQDFTVRRKGYGGAYDPELGEYVGAADTIYTGRGVFGSYNNHEIQATQINITDVKLLCVQIEVSEKPKVDDVVIVGDTERRILDVDQDPAGATWTLQLRGLDVG